MRELEHSYGLSTVVELPVRLSRLRDRWEVTEGKEAFINSDFGQGHSMILLEGFTDEEVIEVVQDNKLSDEIAVFIQEWSGGMPELVRWLVRDAKRVAKTSELEVIARKNSGEQARRFVNWLIILNQ